MKVAISQSNYIPWAGYFGLVAQCDVFVFLDDVQFTSRDWRSRNRIKTARGLKWLSIPVGDSRSRRICDVELPDNDWRRSHRSSIIEAYKGSRNFEFGLDLVDKIFSELAIDTLSNFNQNLIKYIAVEIIGIKCKFLDSREIVQSGVGSDRILSICNSLSTDQYISGPSAASYLNFEDFSSSGIELAFADYSKMRKYEQQHGDYEPKVSIVDMIFNVKSDLSEFIEIGTLCP